MQQIIDWICNIVSDNEISTLTSTFKIVVSLILGAIIGFERQMRRREAGLRTFTLICVGSTVAMIVSIWIPQHYPNLLNGDPGRIAAQVLTGIGFLGAGAIIQSKGGIMGMTTAACIWLIAMVGLAVGAGLYTTALLATLLMLFILISMEQFERRLFLDGRNNILIIKCSTAHPNIELLEKTTMHDRQIVILNKTFECDFVQNTCTINYKVNVKSTFSHIDLCQRLDDLGFVNSVKMVI